MKLLDSHVQDMKRAIAKKQLRESQCQIDPEGPNVTFSSRSRTLTFSRDRVEYKVGRDSRF